MIKKNFSKIFLAILVFFLLLTRFLAYRPSGTYFFDDEKRYETLVTHMREAQNNLDLTVFVKELFSIHARPGYGILYFPSVYLEQKIKDSSIGLGYNLFLNILSIVLLYLILRKLVDLESAVFSAFLVTFSIPSIVYINHMFPYDGSLFVILLFIYVFLAIKSYFILGIGIGLFYLTYPGFIYYLFAIPIIISLFGLPQLKKGQNIKLILFLDLKYWKREINLNILSVLKYGLGFIFVIFLTESASNVFVHISYFETLVTLMGTVSKGDGYSVVSFLVEYILTNDGLFGLAISLLGLIGIFYFPRNKIKNILIIYILITLIVLELSSLLTHKLTFYGRTIRPIYLMLILTFGLTAKDYLQFLSRYFKKHSYFKQIIYIFFIFLFSVNWAFLLDPIRNTVYPEDFIKSARGLVDDQKRVNINKININKVDESDIGHVDRVPEFALKGGQYYLVNEELLNPYFGMWTIPCEREILFEKPHALATFKPYHLEGFNKLQREILRKEPPKYFFIYCK